MIDKLKMIGIAKDTVNISKTGKYKVGNKEINFENSIKSKLYKPEELNNISEKINNRHSEDNNAQITLANESVIDTILKLSELGIDMSELCVLNFASAKNPGGGFLNGAMAQEEALAYCSNLYISQLGSEYYEENKKNKKPTYTDNMIYSTVTFFRDGRFNLIDKPVITNVITAPAVNMKEVVKRKESKSKAEYIMKHRMQLIIDLMIENKCKIAVLDAYGCGIFGNNPHEIANNWKTILNSRKYFDKVIFSISGSTTSENYFAFKRIFG